MSQPLFIGIDLGTSGARVCVIDRTGQVRSQARVPMGDDSQVDAHRRQPDRWWCAASQALQQSLQGINPAHVRAVSVDGTSGTVLAVDVFGEPLADALMYNDACTDAALLARIDRYAPNRSAARGATSALAHMLQLQSIEGCHMLLHQADWIASRLSGRFISDENNALKSGYDVMARKWPSWLHDAGQDMTRLPPVVAAGTPVGTLDPVAATHFGLNADTLVVAGTTDGCASFLATGASQPGDGVTSLGTTLTIKLLSQHPVFAPECGIYSHRVLGRWLAGGASNTGGGVLLHHFDRDALVRLSAQIDTDSPSALDYYPLVEPGERFPVANPVLAPCVTPRPDSDVAFLKGLLDGMARIEHAGYETLARFGTSPLCHLRTVGGGAANPAWQALRINRLRVPVMPAESTEAGVGAARLARHGADQGSH